MPTPIPCQVYGVDDSRMRHVLETSLLIQACTVQVLGGMMIQTDLAFPLTHYTVSTPFTRDNSLLAFVDFSLAL